MSVVGNGSTSGLTIPGHAPHNEIYRYPTRSLAAPPTPPTHTSTWACQSSGCVQDLPREMIPVDYRGGPNGTAQPWARKQYEGKSNRGVYCTFPGSPPPDPEPAYGR